MKLKTNWHATWTPWMEYQDRRTQLPYKSRRRHLFCGKILLATLVQTTNPQHKDHPFFMYSSGPPCGRRVTRAQTVFRCVRQFVRLELLQ